MRILIAEDETISRRVLESTLTKWGYEVVATCDGNEAWEELRREAPPPIAILDLMMPGMDGLEVCRKTRQRPFGTPLYIILLTAKTSKEDIVSGLDAGADDFVAKPFDNDELRSRLRAGIRVIELHQKLAERLSELEQALAQVKQLQGLLPICSYCKSIRDDQNYWQRVENYISEHTDAQFSHGICPNCYETIVQPQIEEIKHRKEGRA
jgi:phosphoserine phosphatase RsbU/P